MVGMRQNKQPNSISYGLTSREARRRLKTYGPNKVATGENKSKVRLFLSKFTSPLTLILLVSATISLTLGEVASGSIIIAIVLISGILDFTNSYRSAKAAEDLQKSVRVNAKVIRDGITKSIPLSCIVPGDVVRLSAGSIVPADGETVDSNALTIDESALTGESYPVEKEAGSSLRMGSNAISGEGLMRVTATGKNTEFAKMSASLRRQTSTEFDTEIAKFSALVSRITLLLVVFILAIDMLLKHDTINSLLFALALAVGLTPELLPLIITANLTRGSLNMAKKGVIVKKLSAIQNLGAMDVFCTDKTGTLTENKIGVAGASDFYGGETGRILELAAVVCKYTSSFESPLDVAVMKYSSYNWRGYRKVQEIPFDFERKRESVVVRTSNGRRLITKGASENLFPLLCGYRAKNGERKRLTPKSMQTIKNMYHELCSDGYRVIMVASREIGDDEKYTPSDETALTFEGYIMFTDPPKASAKQSLAQLKAANIDIKIITGDDPLVAQKVGSDLGLDVSGVLTGTEISHMSQAQLARKVERATIFARVDPNQKLVIIEALRKRHVVGYMGDGINDAPSLRTADIGISVNNAVDVAKDTADIILKGKSLCYLYDGVIEGRRTFANTMKYLKMALSSNFGNMFSMAGSSIFLPFLPMTAPQILLNNLLYDASQFAIPMDNVDENQLLTPQRMELGQLKRFMLIFGPLSSLFDIVTFVVLLHVFHASASLFQTGWFVESMLTQVLVVFIIRTKGLAVRSRPAKALVFSTLSVCLIAIGLALSPIGKYLGFTIMPLPILSAIFAITAAYLLTVEIVKHLTRV